MASRGWIQRAWNQWTAFSATSFRGTLIVGSLTRHENIRITSAFLLSVFALHFGGYLADMIPDADLRKALAFSGEWRRSVHRP
jgi:hypothetical protein